MKDNRNPDCPCKRIKCQRHGDCRACTKHHTDEGRMLTACRRLKEKQKNKAVTDKAE